MRYPSNVRFERLSQKRLGNGQEATFSRRDKLFWALEHIPAKNNPRALAYRCREAMNRRRASISTPIRIICASRQTRSTEVFSQRDREPATTYALANPIARWQTSREDERSTPRRTPRRDEQSFPCPSG